MAGQKWWAIERLDYLKDLLFLKIALILLCFCIALGAYAYRNNIKNYFSDIKWHSTVDSLETISLNYPTDISTIWISGSEFDEKAIIENTADIDNLFAQLNSLELVKRGDKSINYSKPFINLETAIQSEEAKGNYGSHIVLSEQYIFVYPSNYENIYSVYYVKDPDISLADEENQIVQYLKSLI